ncbi:VirB8 family protein [Solidesulfovibrio carbinoliphilus subsp. oakridgensis]|uniref:VirB8 family protein n=1 Tax=Solidesulfovibrio carbinoliphilus subsp. oakridgensis TaxID=694327 RepID=G7QB66_9BACT|nr:type IV secretion system protein [Solidesulfovibrio carbinoliphilus]EHJ48808.1 VirB8 family protein [Solidesulfovibrio carbinoliphilus subsp. oakridgensis]
MPGKSKPKAEFVGKAILPAEKCSYVSGREEWLERYGSYIQRARQWRLVAFGCLAITGISIAGNVIQAGQQKIVPYVVEVDKLGRIAAVAQASEASATPTRVIQATLADFVVNWRTVTADLDLEKRLLERLSYYVTGAAKGQMRQWYEINNPYDRAKTSLVQVYVKSLPSPVSVDSWRVEWDEVTRNHSGVQISSESYQATLTIQMQPPTTDAQVIRNPGGIYVVAMSSSTIMEPTTSTSRK